MPATANHIYSYRCVLMGSPILLKLFVDDAQAVQQVFGRIKQLEDMFTVNRPHSQIMSINHAAGQHPVSVSAMVYQLIKRAKNASILPDSCFNFAIGPLVKCWKIGFSGNHVPDAPQIAERLALTNPNDVLLNDAQRTVFLRHAGMEIDLGAIAKGYIADIIKQQLHSLNIHHAIINLGGNVQTVGGSLSDAQGEWHIGLQKPFASAGTLIGTLQLQDRSVVTSGVYERYFSIDGNIYHHILNPKTGYPLDNELHSVTIISEHSLDGDIYSTLLYGMGVKQGLQALQETPGIEAIFVTKDQRVILSSQHHFHFRLQDNRYQLVVAP
jgi:thiamine biosynthesis lipoprotein